MKNAYLWLGTVGLALVLFIACAENTNQSADKDSKLLPDLEDTSATEEAAALAIASEASMAGGQKLVAMLMQAIEDSGTAQAVVFCNLNVGGIYDSLKAAYGVDVTRVSHKNRNLGNAANERELKLIEEYSTATRKDAVAIFDEGNHYTGYRPIRMMMPTCLKCHGQPGVDIEETTFITINMLYPADKATGFKHMDVRGLWRVSVPKAVL